MSNDGDLDIQTSGDNGLNVVSTVQDGDVLVLTNPDEDRYNNFTFISWWKQTVIREATVLVIGAGALGNEVLKNLALMGVGRIIVVDFDIIQKANLSRSVLFREQHDKQKKAEVAAKAVRDLNPDVKVCWLDADIVHGLGLGVYRRASVVIGCLDNREARLAVNHACWHLNRPWVDGGLHEMSGLMRVFWPNRGACYECTLTDEDYRLMSLHESCGLVAHAYALEGKIATTPTISAIIAGFQTQEALKILHDFPVKTGQALVVNGLGSEAFDMVYSERPDCQSHWVFDEIVEISTACASSMTVREMLAFARNHLGEDARVIIPKFVSNASCVNKQCVGYGKDLRQPLHTLTSESANCPHCHEPLKLTITEVIKGDEDFLDLRLAEVGIPPLAVLVAETPAHRYGFFELTGDLENTLIFEGGVH